MLLTGYDTFGVPRDEAQVWNKRWIKWRGNGLPRIIWKMAV